MDRTRFKDAMWLPQQEEKCIIGGCGGIGSWLAFFLNRAGFHTIVFDDDTVEEVNLGGQLFSKKSVGMSKVQALNNLTLDFCETSITGFHQKFTKDSMSHIFMFSAFDNMKARKDMFEVWKKSIPKSMIIPIFIDGRLEAEQLQIFCVTPDKIEEYEKHLFADMEVEAISCTLKQTSHCAAMIASHMMSFFTNHMTNIYEREGIREIPFYYEYFIPLSLTKET